jgi:hypothetical protein
VATFLNVDIVPAAARPKPITTALDEALALRDRFRDAQAQVARAQSELEAQEQADVETAAKAIRAGQSPGAASTAIKRCHDKLAAAQRNASALNLAAETAAMDTVETIRKGADGWFAALDTELEKARKRGLEAVAQLEQAAAEIGAAAGARYWISSAITDNRFDRPLKASRLGSIAPSSAKLTTNSAPLGITEITTFARELFAEPAPAPIVAEPVV